MPSRVRLLSIFGLPPVACALVAGLHGCSREAEDTHIAIATDLTFPRGVLMRVTKLTLSVLEGDVTCDPTKGAASFPSGAENATEIAHRELGTSGCATGARFCGDVTIEKSDAPRVFVATATDDKNAMLAVGCASARVDQDAVPVSIRMLRFIPASVCGDGTLQPTEQCEPPNTTVCDEACQSKEILLSTGSTDNGTSTGGPGDKTDPFFVWPPGSGSRFVACFTDHAVAGGGNLDIGVRVMGDDLAPLTSPPALAAGSIFLPNGATFPPLASPRQQSVPSAALLNDKYYVAFQDDDAPPANGQDIHLRSMDTAFVAGEGATPIGINGAGGAGEPNIQGSPSIAAGPNGRLFIAWEDTTLGKIAGRTLAPPSTLGNQNDLSTGTGNTSVSVAATTTGWVAAWQSGTGIKLRILNADGTPQGADDTVTESGAAGTRPRVASLADGRFAITWAQAGDIFVQRYDAIGTKIAGDQSAPVNQKTDGDQTTPAIGATPAEGGSYVVAWIDVNEGHVRARMLGGSSGFLFNNVDGQAGEFQASRAGARTRKTPVVVSGGQAPFVGIGWEDTTSPGAGIVVRRFPLPVD